MWPYRDLKSIIDWLNCRTTVYCEIVTQIVMVLLETYLLNAFLRHNISVPVRTVQSWGTVREPKVALL